VIVELVTASLPIHCTKSVECTKLAAINRDKEIAQMPEMKDRKVEDLSVYMVFAPGVWVSIREQS
jgi:hypothetical protein